ncbi:hypothetical protein CJD36_007170 [Flavipsychrobacter stenotrophus]|uniref:Activator of Hsp90 ATPase homologue 1/2-like C-terminal domain-containing protein n=1 Tax=Flavipsychrobacter stenotrophus TaxID=2077091 RepID=A0A2S7SXC1_9BACT|nr:SRPBCC domain-containing protein [Flavipsychrobacter stenotrophus]PQJ11570.1 hypothetical protein CJD36_007170 [Flavipsychrobacter stenotrophus]
MNTQPIVIERIYNAPAERVWLAIASKEGMKKWYLNLDEFKPEVGFEFSFTGGEPGGTQYLHLSKVMEVIPGKKLSYSWRFDGYEGDSLVTWELFAEGDKTRLRLTHAGIHTFPQSNKDFYAPKFTEGWTILLGSMLQKYVETTDREIIVSRLLNAPVELVFEVWTKPEHVAKWYGPDGFTITTSDMNVKKGAEWNFMMHGPDGTDYPNKVQYTEVVKNERLEYIYGSGAENGEGDFNVTVTFEAQGDKTLLTMRSVFATAEERDTVVTDFGAIEGGNQTMNKLEAYLAELK